MTDSGGKPVVAIVPEFAVVAGRVPVMIDSATGANEVIAVAV